ncbi:MAG: UrcA family protein [Hyphomonadaceae bacterium]|nr:UrcA family protein [Hyphomonadaceae bacterium]
MKQALIAGAFALAAIAAFATPASADTPRDRRAEIVRTADLDLTAEAGAAALEGRIRAAARRVCHRPDAPGDLVHWQRYRTCMQRTLAKAVAKIDAPLVLARFDDVRNPGAFETAALRY